jgi:hypothetical protein
LPSGIWQLLCDARSRVMYEAKFTSPPQPARLPEIDMPRDAPRLMRTVAKALGATAPVSDRSHCHLSEDYASIPLDDVRFVAT